MDLVSYVALGLLVVLLVFCALTLRRVRAVREGGIHVALRTRVDGTGRGWKLGIGHYHGDVFEWYRVLGLSLKPDRVLTRRGVEIADRRAPLLPETYAMPAGATVLRCYAQPRSEPGRVDEVELAMGADALTGFLSWLESAPPSRKFPHAS